MTDGERAVWIAVYAASWHESTGQEIGVVLDESRARWCARQATKALDALRGIVDSVEVLK